MEVTAFLNECLSVLMDGWERLPLQMLQQKDGHRREKLRKGLLLPLQHALRGEYFLHYFRRKTDSYRLDDLSMTLFVVVV